MTRNLNYDDASSMKRIKTCGNGGVAPFSDVNDDVFFLVMMRLGVVDFLAFSGVCKSWRSFALSNRDIFMASRPPMLIRNSAEANENENENENEKEWYCHLEDFEGRRFITILPHSAGRTCHGITCGYSILSSLKTNDFWLVNPITRHELHFTDIPFNLFVEPAHIRAILVFSPSIFGWVFVISNLGDNKIWFCTAGKAAWNHVSSTSPILDLHVFKGKIYTLSIEDFLWEIKLNPKPILMLLETKNFLKTFLWSYFVSSGENLYLMKYVSKGLYEIHEINFSEMKRMVHRKTTDEYVFFLSTLKQSAAVKTELWADSKSQYLRYADTNKSGKSGKGRLLIAKMWYFPHDCLNVNLIQDRGLFSILIWLFSVVHMLGYSGDSMTITR